MKTRLRVKGKELDLDRLRAINTAIMEIPDGGLFCLDMDYKYSCFSASHAVFMKEMFGSSIEVGRSFFDYWSTPQDAARLKSNIDRALQGDMFTEEMELDDRHLVALPSQVTYDPIRNGTGEIIGVAVYWRSMTDRGRHTETLSQHESRCRRLFDSVRDLIILLEEQTGVVLDANKPFLDLFGATRESLVGGRVWEANVLERIFPDEEHYHKFVANGSAHYDDLRVTARAGRSLRMDMRSIVCEFEEVPCIQLNLLDVTEKKQQEERIRESEEKFRGLYENSAVGIMLSAPDGRVYAANSFACDLLGMTEEEICLVGRSGFVDAADPRLTQLLGRWGKERMAVGEVRLVRKDGSKFEAKVSSVLFHDRYGNERTSLLIEDLTNEKMNEELMRRQEFLLKSTQQVARIGSWEWDVESGKVEWSEEMFDILSIAPDGFDGNFGSMRAIVHPDDLAKYDEALERAVTGEERSESPFVYRVILPTGEVKHLLVIASFKDGQSAAHKRLLGTVQDVTGWKMTEELVRLQSHALQSAANAIVITDITGAIVFVNDSFEKLTGYSAEEVIGKNPKILKSGRQRSDYYRDLWDSILAGKVWRGVLVNKKKNGELYNEEQTITPVRDESGRLSHFIAIKQDITERIESEARLRSLSESLHMLAARLEAAREDERKTISREIHDQLGQLLTGAKVSLLGFDPSNELTPASITEKVAHAVSMLDEAMDTVRDISGKLRPGVLDYLGLISAIEWETERFRGTTGIACTLNLPQDGQPLDSERSTTLFRIFQEALTNVARHAKATELTVTLTVTRSAYFMKVEDNGIGISEKEIESPNALGLIGIRERLYRFGGKLEILSPRNGGTALTIHLPTS